jgi:hypothetical protein
LLFKNFLKFCKILYKCHIAKHSNKKIEEIKEKAKILENLLLNLLLEYKSTGNEEIAEEIDRIL